MVCISDDCFSKVGAGGHCSDIAGINMGYMLWQQEVCQGLWCGVVVAVSLTELESSQHTAGLILPFLLPLVIKIPQPLLNPSEPWTDISRQL